MRGPDAKSRRSLQIRTRSRQSVRSAPDTAAKVKILTSAIKSALKGQTLAEAIAECVAKGSGGGGGGGGHWYDWSLTVTVKGTKTDAYQNGQTGLPDNVTVIYFVGGDLSVNMSKEAGSPSLYFAANVGDPASGAHAISLGSWLDGTNSYTITSGTVTITKWPTTFPGTGKADFTFDAVNGNDTNDVITGATGSFSVWIYPPF